ncbi:hypothetical protein V8E36_004228, partial [Tilletia maclaganii]
MPPRLRLREAGSAAVPLLLLPAAAAAVGGAAPAAAGSGCMVCRKGMMCGAAPGSELTAWVKMCWRAWRQAEWEAALAWGPAAKDCRGVWAREDASAARFSRVSWEELELCAAAAAVVA